jgi:hypothetical protein
MYFALVFALSFPFWWIGAVTGLQLVPGLPVGAFMVLAPLVAALILVYRENRSVGIAELLKRAFDYRRIRAKVWYVAAALLMPGLLLLAWELMRLSSGSVPPSGVPAPAALLMLLAFFVAGLSEELGWSGYAIDPLQTRWGALRASILVGVVWAVWHLVPLTQAHRAPPWIAWWCLFTVAIRILYVWLYNNTGKSVFAVALCHGMENFSTYVFPFSGSTYDPRFTAPVAACAAAIIIALWGPRTLARFGNAPDTPRGRP